MMNSESIAREKRVCVVVLGDIGRSPRMTFHALSLTKFGFHVDLVGYGGSSPHKDLLTNELIKLHVMTEPPSFIQKLPRYAVYGFKVVWQFFAVLFTLLSLPRPTHILAQNPPSVPMLAVIWCFSCLKSCKVIVDWHNYGFTVLSMTLGSRNLVVRFSKWFEFFFGRKASAHFCVTKAMQYDLETNWNIRAKILYDRPPEMYRSITLSEKHHVFLKLAEKYSCFRKADDQSENVFTQEVAQVIQYRENRPVLLVSSTSWTEDEDFSILLDALEKYDSSVGHGNCPEIICVITGKGPLKDYYTDLISTKQFNNVRFCMPWLSAEDYPLLLASADLGVCLHTSSSGLDLPMKVVDMFGCGLPVLAMDFKSLPELVQHNHNGLVFHDSDELKEQLQNLLQGFPEHSGTLQTFRDNLQSFQLLRWDDCWAANALPVFCD